MIRTTTTTTIDENSHDGNDHVQQISSSSSLSISSDSTTTTTTGGTKVMMATTVVHDETPPPKSRKQLQQQQHPHHLNHQRKSIIFNRILLRIYYVVLHLIVIALYAVPVFYQSTRTTQQQVQVQAVPTPVLDELHIVSNQNIDVNGYYDNNHSTTSILYHIFTNDYWGRPMNASNSHKSWRPLSILLFRYVRGLQIPSSRRHNNNDDNNNKSWSSSSTIRRYIQQSITTTLRFIFMNNKYITKKWVKDWFIPFITNDLNIHRFVNILTHATIAEMVATITTKVCMIRTTRPIIQSTSSSSIVLVRTQQHQQQQHYQLYKILLYSITKILWSLQSTHVEVTVNAANRPHLLALLCSMFLCDPNTSIILFGIILCCGYLFCETFLFQIIPIGVTLIVIQYVRMYHHSKYQQSQQQQQQHPSKIIQLLYNTMIRQYNIFIRLILLVLSGMTYYWGRYSYDTLSIPVGLIRPAENPFYTFVGMERFYNYSYVLAIHILKQWNFDIIGYSHEYGYECITKINHWKDIRLCIPLSIVLLHVLIGIFILWYQRNDPFLSTSFLLYFIHLSWLVTLFPVSGIIKVGTFIADRIAVAGTVSVTMIMAHILTRWIMMGVLSSSQQQQQTTSSLSSSIISFSSLVRQSYKKLFLLWFLLILMYSKIYIRCGEWLGSVSLLESSLRTCPRFAKAHLEISKIYSGLYPDLFNLTRSIYHLQQVENIDVNYCDVHQQFAHVAIQQQQYMIFEERLMKSLLCPFTMGGAIPLWQRYWKAVLDPTTNSLPSIQAAQIRQQTYQKQIQHAIEQDELSKKNQQQQLSDDTSVIEKSPLVLGWKK